MIRAAGKSLRIRPIESKFHGFLSVTKRAAPAAGSSSRNTARHWTSFSSGICANGVARTCARKSGRIVRMPAVSPPVATAECAPITLSTSVVPERGMPTMKIGIGPVSVSADCAGGTLLKIEISSAVFRSLWPRS